MSKKRKHAEAAADVDEAAPFPRGGASILTPLEERKLKLQAKADFEREGGAPAEGKIKRRKSSKTAPDESEEVRTGNKW